ncbi:unnamed protein product [Hymenolepis diminuta]|uniref:Uncharacterized protein n=1 Tax=Hymenolepis diminuta TaxID=6216 RepID=A0A564YQL8_HYMDI|nr:unnamed protein product [Hymenolepis diminuta]
MRRHPVTVIVFIKPNHINLDIAGFLQVATSCLCKIRKALLNENNVDELAAPRARENNIVNALLTHSEHLGL